MIVVSCVTIEIRGAGSWREATQVAGSGLVSMLSVNLRKMKVCSASVARPWWAKWERVGKRWETAGSRHRETMRASLKLHEVAGHREPQWISKTKSFEYLFSCQGNERKLTVLAPTSWIVSIKALLHFLAI